MAGRITFKAGGKYTEKADTIVWHARKGSIKETSVKGGVLYRGEEGGIKHFDYEPLEEPAKDFKVKLEWLKQKREFVPFGIPSFKGEKTNDHFRFKITITGQGVNQWNLVVKAGATQVYHCASNSVELDEVIVTAKKPAGKTKGSNPAPKPAPNPPAEPRSWPAGVYYIEWDGFDSNGIYDSTLFTQNELKAELTARANGKSRTAESEAFTFKYQEVQWVDTKIDKNQKRIDITLRVNLTDGGAEGLKCVERDMDPDPKHRQMHTFCPWDKIPKSILSKYGKPPLKKQTKSFKELEKLALDGINYHWSRNKNHFIAKDVTINKENYEIYVHALNLRTDTMDDVELIYNTNNGWLRSGNPGTVEDPVSFFGNVFSREAICYNVGYIDVSSWYNATKDWRYYHQYNEDLEFKFTSAHEIGHTILKAYGGTAYSYGHKGSVNVVLQKRKSSAENVPSTGEIDIMPYYPNGPFINDLNRCAALEKDALSLLWLSKINCE